MAFYSIGMENKVVFFEEMTNAIIRKTSDGYHVETTEITGDFTESEFFALVDDTVREWLSL